MNAKNPFKAVKSADCFHFKSLWLKETMQMQKQV